MVQAYRYLVLLDWGRKMMIIGFKVIIGFILGKRFTTGFLYSDCWFDVEWFELIICRWCRLGVSQPMSDVFLGLSEGETSIWCPKVENVVPHHGSEVAWDWVKSLHHKLYIIKRLINNYVGCFGTILIWILLNDDKTIIRYLWSEWSKKPISKNSDRRKVPTAKSLRCPDHVISILCSGRCWENGRI